MKAILRITDGPAAGERIIVTPGQQMTVGRSDQADFTIALDQLMSSLHFSLRCDEESCMFEDLNSTNGSAINGEPVMRKPLHDGDFLTCGNSRFDIAIDRGGAPPVVAPSMAAAAPPVATVPAPNPVATQPAAIESPTQTAENVLEVIGPERGFLAPSAQEIRDRFELSEVIQVPCENGEPPEQYAERLTHQDHLNDALTFLAYALPKRLAVWWATRCMREVAQELSEDDEAALQAAENWVKSPTDETRRAAMVLAQKQDCGTAACWPAVGAFWSHGSMSPPENPVVPPGDGFCGKAISGAVIMAAVMDEPEKGVEKQKRFFQIALAVAKGEETWKAE